jgi:hypothetical protein
MAGDESFARHSLLHSLRSSFNHPFAVCACRHQHVARAHGDLLLASANAPLDTPSTSYLTSHITDTLSALRALSFLSAGGTLCRHRHGAFTQ